MDAHAVFHVSIDTAHAGVQRGDRDVRNSENRRFVFNDRRPDGTPPLNNLDPKLGTGRIGFDWTSLVPFNLNASLYFFAHQFGSGRQAIFQMNAAGDTLTETWSSSPGITWTHLVTLPLAGAPHYVSYNSITGDAALFRIDSDAADPTPVTMMKWDAWHTAVASFMLNGSPYVLTYAIATGEVIVRRITSAGPFTTFAPGWDFWQRNITHVAFVDVRCCLNGFVANNWLVA